MFLMFDALIFDYGKIFESVIKTEVSLSEAHDNKGSLLFVSRLLGGRVCGR